MLVIMVSSTEILAMSSLFFTSSIQEYKKKHWPSKLENKQAAYSMASNTIISKTDIREE
jgi:preprotein translocase subunit SecE